MSGLYRSFRLSTAMSAVLFLMLWQFMRMHLKFVSSSVYRCSCYWLCYYYV